MQLIFLGGIVCLAIAPHLRWWPPESSNVISWYSSEFNQAVRTQWLYYLALVLLPIDFACTAGYFVSFWPGKHAVRRMCWFVLVPGLAGLIAIAGRFVYLLLPRSSIFDSTASRFSRSVAWSLAALWNLGPGFHICLLGIGLILLFTIRLSLGLTSLPLALTSHGTSSIEDGDEWRRTRMLVLYIVTPLFILPSVVIALPMIVFPAADPSSLSSAEILYIHLLQDVISSFATIGIAMWISGPAGRQEIKRWLSWSNPVYLALSLAIPFGLGASFSVGRYLYDHIYWSAHNYGHFAPPAFTDYFSALHFNLLWLIFAAFAEEVVFRAFIQPRLIQRYGMWRGLFLVVIVWSAYHFYSDFNSRMRELDVLSEMGMRLLVCTSLGFVLGWLTLRARSIWPAVIAHASYNIILYSGFAFQFQGEEIVRIALWAILAFVLFRYWPVQIEAPPENSPPMLVEA